MTGRPTLAPVLLASALVAFAAPVEAQLVVNTPFVHDLEVVPGRRIEGVVPLRNDGDAPRTARLYLTDYAFDASGTSRYDAPGTLARSAAAWVSVGTSEVIVPPGETVEVRYAIDVPVEADAVGTRWCALMVEDRPAEAEEVGSGVGIRRRVRYAIQLALQFGGGAPDLDIADLGLAEGATAGRQLWLDLANTGDATADTEVSLELFDADGHSRGRHGGSRARLYPGTSFRHRVGLVDVPPGEYLALVIVETGDEHAIGSQFTLEL